MILLHKILNDNGISSEEIVKIRKEYYIVSKTPLNKNNKSNWHRKGKSNEIFGFIDKIRPFHFIKVDHLDEKAFLSLIGTLKRMLNKILALLLS